jgi:hypothetical protein
VSDERGAKRDPTPLRGPFAARSAATRRRILWIAGAAALAIWVFLFIQDSEIKDSGGPGIIGFEVAGTEKEAQEILEEWGAQGRDDARVSIYADFPYLIAYSVFLAVGCTIASERLGRRGMTRLARLGPLLGWSMFAAAAFDAIENFAMLRVIDGHTATWPGIALYAAIPKFAIAALGIAYVIAGAVLGHGGRSRDPKPAAGEGLAGSAQ